jgi:hypothetical protein
MSADRDAILSHLEVVEAERRRRKQDAELGRNVWALKAYQQHRFTRTYADLLASERYGPAARFFLEELYGPQDFTRRDEQFVKIVSGLGMLFPPEVALTVASVAEVHALSEVLDTAMAQQLRAEAIAPLDYVRAWQAVGRAADRHKQVTLTVEVAGALDRMTRKPLLRKTLHLMRGPARAADLTELQHFIERGFDTFASMRGARQFIDIVRAREDAFAAALFAADPADAGAATTDVLAALA